MKQDWSIEIETKGRCGLVHYHEGQNKISFDWEFGGDPKIIVIIWGPPPDKWDDLFPWAKGRHIEIMQRVASEAIKQQAPNCFPEYHYDKNTIYIKTA